MNRREFVRTAGGATTGAAALSASAGAAAQEGGNATAGGENATAGGENGTAGGGQAAADLPQPDFGGWFGNVPNYTDDVVRQLNQETATVEVGVDDTVGGNLAFGPPALHVSTGTTVQWDWTGEGGGHNVISEGEGSLDSGDTTAEAGVHYEYTFDEAGIYPYYCSPHRNSGMKAAVVVGQDYPAVEEGGVETLNPEEAGVPIRPHYVGIATALMVVVALTFSFFVLKYGESPHTSGGND